MTVERNRMMRPHLPFLALGAAFAVQTAHHFEHVAQLVQIYAYRVKPAQADGLLGSAFDFEWVHFTYNFGLELALIGLWLTYRRLGHGGPRGTAILGSLAVFQGYHSLEHAAKLWQYLSVAAYQSGAVPTPGFLPQVTGWPIFLVHFWFNMIVWALLAWAVWQMRPRRWQPAPALAG